MPKRFYFVCMIAVGVGVIVYLSRFGSDEVGGDGKATTEGREVGKSRESVEWNRVLDRTAGMESLDSLRETLMAMSKEDAVAEIEGFLKRGEDRGTGLEFEIGTGGKMKGWPTLRVYLLDLLLEIDPAEAARISREVLASPTSADEWAICLRNVARGEGYAGNRDYLRAKTEELIRNEDWQARPSVGFLNAFDVLVHVGATESTGLLSGFIQNKERRDLAHAGFLTLDRLVQREPVDMLNRLKADEALRTSRPEMVSQQFARADLRDETQREIVKSWLLDPKRTPTELQNFAGVYPNNNKMISQNLLTTEQMTEGIDLREHDADVLELIRSWRNDPAFKSLGVYLETMEGRLLEFTKDSGGGR